MRISFKGKWTAGDRSTAIQGISIGVGSTSIGDYTYEQCKDAAIENGYQYFALQNVNTSNSKGFCAVSNSEPSITQYGESKVASKQIALWSSNTANQPGNIATLTTTGSLAVLNSNGQAIFSSPIKEPENGGYLGCYADTSNRAMPNTSNNAYYSLDKCKELAQEKGYKYYAGQNAGKDKNGNWNVWCAGSNDLGTAKKYGVATNCINANGTMLGGGWSNSIYSLSAEGNYYLILQDDGNMVIYRGSGPSDNQGSVWSTQTNGKQQSANPDVVATKGKFGQNWMSNGSSLAAGEFIGSNDGKMALVMQADGNLVLYTYQMDTNCQKMSDGNTGGGVGANAVYDIGLTAVKKNMGILGYIDEDSNLYTYPNTNKQYNNTYTIVTNNNTPGNDIPGAAFGNATIDSCQTACNNNKQCAGFVFNGSNCWPKTSSMYPFGGSIQSSMGTEIHIRGRQPSSPPLGVSTNTNITDSVTYNKYINKGAIGNQYGLANATSTQKQQLEQLETKMDLLTNQINDLTNNFEGGTMKAENQSTENNSGISQYVDDIKNTNKKIGVVARETKGNIHNILSDSDIVVLQKNYDYLFWSILAAGTVLVSMNIVKK